MSKLNLIVPVLILVVTCKGYSQHLLARDLEKDKVVKVKFGKELSVITKTDTLDFFNTVFNEESQEWEDVWTGYWYLAGMDADNKSITLWNNLTEESVDLATDDIEQLIFKRDDRGVMRKILLGTCVGGIVWAAASKNTTQSVAAIGLTVASAAYLAATIGRTHYRHYTLVGIMD